MPARRQSSFQPTEPRYRISQPERSDGLLDLYGRRRRGQVSEVFVYGPGENISLLRDNGNRLVQVRAGPLLEKAAVECDIPSGGSQRRSQQQGQSRFATAAATDDRHMVAGRNA